jgi:YD repeat-containing protein
MNRGFVGVLAWLLVVLAMPLAAQEPVERAISYGEIQSDFFDDETSHEWQFTGNAGDIVEIRANRIGGRFEPGISILAPNGTVVTGDNSYLSLPSDGLYHIQINEQADQNTSPLLLNEYSLSLKLLARHRPAIEDGLEPIPNLADFPDIFTGEGIIEPTLGILLFGTAELSQPDRVNARNTYLLSGSRTLSLNNANPLARGIVAIALSEDAVALRSSTGAVFYTDQDILALETISGITSLSLANGQSIVTDFYRISSMQSVDNTLVVNFVDGQQMVSTDQIFEFLRRGGINGEGPNVEPVNLIRVSGAELQTDLEAWQTLTIMSEDVRVYYDELRYLSESPALSLFSDDGMLQITEGEISMSVEPRGIGDILLRGGSLTVKALDGREITQAIHSVYDLTIADRNINLRLQDGSSRLSLPDGTLIETPNAIPVDNTALPSQPNFRPRNFNNLGANPFDYHPNPNFDFALLPVNRVNGNFFYPVTDFSLEGDSLNLDWTRTYNSLAPLQQSPAYLNSLSIGQGWRHSFQYELDISYAPLGEVLLSLPDGSRHIFRRQGERFRSLSLLSWTIRQGENASWEAFTTEGQSYEFDSAARLQRISGGRLELLFSPAPHNYLGDYASGFFVTDSYGRRIEVYADENGLIREIHDVLGRSIRYSYNERELSAVDFSHNDEIVTYTYTYGKLSDIFETNNPYHRELHLQYDELGRVVFFQKNGEDRLNARQTFTYAPSTTTEIEYLGESERQHVYSYDEAFRLVRYDTPRPDWSYRWIYSSQTARLNEISQPDLSVLRYQFDEFGYLTNFVDPLFGSGAGSYRFHYSSPDGLVQLLTAIDIPSNDDYLSIDYDAENRLSQLNRAGSITSYTYDAMGRVQSINHPARTIAYSYDDFGYPTRIDEGNGARIIQRQHDILGRLLSETDGRGTVTNYLWSSSHNRLDRIIVDDWIYEFSYDAFGNLASKSFNGHEIHFEYDELNNRLNSAEMVANDSFEYSYTYDEAGNVLSISKPDGSIESFTYDALNMLTSHTDSHGLTTTYAVEVNIAGSRTSYIATYPGGEVSRFVYDPLGRIRQLVSLDRTGEQIINYNFSYNALGYLSKIEETHVPGGRTLDLSYDLLANPLSVTLNNSATTRYTYNEAGQLLSETDPEGRVTRYSYDALANVISQTQADGSILRYSYDENANRTSFTEAGGAEWFYNYDSHNRLTEIIDPANNFTSYEYDDLGNLSAIINANDTRISMSYDAASRLTDFTDLAGNSTHYRYDNRNNITRIEQSGGLNSDFFYDSSDNLVALTQSGGRETLFGRDNEERVVSITDSLGHTSFFAYNTIGTIGRITNPLGNETIYRWSASGRIVGYSNSSGASYSYAMDSIGRLQSINDIASNQTIALNTFIEYDDSGYITALRFGTTGTINTNQAIVHRYTYTPNGQIATYQPPEASAAYRFDYDVNGRMVLSTDPAGIITSYSYDILGNVTAIRRAVDTDVETLETFTYDTLGNLTRYTATDGVISDFVYDSANRLTGRSETGLGGDTRNYFYDYDAYGRVTRSVDPNGQETGYRYDLYGNLIVVERGGSTTRYEYDEVDNLRRIELPAGQSILITYNALRQPVRYSDAENNAWTYSYDDSGNLSQLTDPLGNSTAYRYDVTNRLIAIVSASDALTELAYDNQGNLSELRFPNNQRIRPHFDRADNLTSLEYNTSQVIRYERDTLGRVTTQTNADGQEITYGYDAQSNLTSIESPETTQRRSYDSAGRLSQISQGTTIIRYTYNGFGYLAQYRSSQVTANYTFDNAGNLLSRDAGDYGRIDYSYDALYRPIRITMGDEWIEIEYNENGWRTSLKRSNGLETRYVYDDNGRLRNILHLDAAEERLDGFAYEYDAIGNILRVTRIDNWAVLYSYDEAQNLINERWLSDENQIRYSVSYAYDAANNRSEETKRIGQANPERTVFVYNNQNQLVEEIHNAEFTIEDRLALPLIGGMVLTVPAFWFSRRRRNYLPILLAIIPLSLPFFQQITIPSTRYSYDANGNLIEVENGLNGNLSLAYDSFQRLVALDGDTITTRISYDPLGNVTEIIENGTRYRFIYDHFGLLAIESNGETTLYFYSSDELLLMNTADGALWPLSDALGTVRNYAAAEGHLLSNAGINPNNFGELIDPYESSNPIGSPQPLFRGGIYLPEAEIYLFGARAYEPRLGRELQRPPLPDYVFNQSNLLEPALAGLNPKVSDIDPRRFVPNPAMSPLPILPDVHSAQAAETRRVLAVADIAYQQMNQPNILAQFSAGSLLIPSASIPPVVRQGSEGLVDSFVESLREVPLYPPLLNELPMLLNFVEAQP